jgi:lipoprotein-releasing system permease protein
LKLLVDIAWALLQARRKQSIIAAIGVTFGIAMFITLLSFMTGLNEMLDGLIVNRTPHIRIYKEITVNPEQPIKKWLNSPKDYHFIESVKASNSRVEILKSKEILNNLSQDDRVLGYSRKVSSPAFFNLGTIDIAGFLNGIDVEEEIKYYRFTDYVTKGNPIDIKNVPNSIILGKPLAEKLLADIGDIIQITTSQGDRFQLKVVGYYQSGIADFDKTQSFASVATTQKILGKGPDYITDIQVKLKDILLAPKIAPEYQKKFNTNAIDIQRANAQFETGTKVRNIISYAVGITLLIVAGFGIYNILNMMIYEKMDTIAILKATGFSGYDVKSIFIIISLTIGIAGCFAGLFFGFLMTLFISTIPFNTEALPTIKTYPVSYNVIFYFIAFCFSLITTFLAGWFPAKKASNIDPVEIIRGK